MNLRRRSFALLLIVLALLFVPTIVDLILKKEPSTDLNQLIGFALTLIGIFGGAYFELDRFERQIKEDRIKEARLYRLDMLSVIEKWTNEISESIDDISVLRELSPKDPKDNILIIGRDKIKPIEEKLLRLDNQWLTVFAKVADVIGIKKDDGKKLEEYKEEHRALLEKIYAIGDSLTTTRDVLAKGNIPSIEHTKHYAHLVTDVRRAIDKIRLTIE
jgi:hypothetical protein